MALVPCKECGAKISTNAPVCPTCGTPWPASHTKASIVFQRSPKALGFANIIKVSIDNKQVCELASGTQFGIDIEPGTYTIRGAGTLGGKSEVTMAFESSKEYIFDMSIKVSLVKPSVIIKVL